MSGAPAAVDGTSVPRARGDVASVTLRGEAVIHRDGRIHLLDPVATLVWRCCDGEASVDDIARELADEFAMPTATLHRDLAAAIAQLDALALLVRDEPEAGTDDGTDLELLVDPPGSCASCADKQWKMRATFRVGARLVTVGTDSARADAAMREALAAHLVVAPAGSESTPPLYALTFPPPRTAGAGPGDPQPLHLLQRGDTVVARSRRADHLVRALVGHLATYTDLPALGLATVGGLVVASGDRAVIVPEPDDLIGFRHALARQGALVADLPVAIVDPRMRQVLVDAPGLSVEHDAIDNLARESGALGPASSEPLPWGRYHLAGIALPAPASPAAALLRLGPARGDHRDHDASFGALLALLDAVPVVEAVEPEAIAALLTER